MTAPARRIQDRLARRHRAERRFRLLGMAAISFGLIFLVILFANIIYTGASAFKQTKIALDIQATTDGDEQGAVKRALRLTFPEVKSRRDKRALYRLVSSGAGFEVRAAMETGTPGTIWVSAADEVDMVVKGTVPRNAAADHRRLSDRQMQWLETLEAAGRVETQFNWTFLTAGDSREPELAGIAVAALGSLFSVLVCLALAFPIGVSTAIYLEEFAPRNRWTDFIEVNINNLASVPSIVFGLLGLAVFLNVFQLPRSAPLTGGMVLALMTLPTIVVTARAAIKAVPSSIREAALAIGASPVRAVFDHVLTLAMPGILTGTIIGTARALGETAPLLMIGMVAFVVDLPSSALDPATALPVQVFLWADNPERAFGERTAAAILVLLIFTCTMNLAAVLLRKKFEIRW